MMTAYQKTREEKPAHSESRKISVGIMNTKAVFRSDCLPLWWLYLQFQMFQ